MSPIIGIMLAAGLAAFVAAQGSVAKEAGMGRVVGIGGVFFKSKDPKALARWYADVLGLEITEWGGVVLPLRVRGATPKSAVQVWSPFNHDTDYFALSTREFMIDFEVDNLDAMLARLKAKGVAILKRYDNDPNGRFAWFLDPGGTKIELWQPKAK